MEFQDWMIGERVKWGDEVGTVTEKHSSIPNEVWVLWDIDKCLLHIEVEELEFISDKESISEITINGKRYKLMEIV